MKKAVNIEYVKKDFDVNQGIPLPKEITYHEVDRKHLFIAPEKAAWIATNDIGKDFLNYFRKGFSIKQAVKKMNLNGIEMGKITSELRTFLINVEKKGFLEDAVVREEEIETTLQLYLTARCNLDCIHCYINASKISKNELNTEEFTTIIDDFSRISKSKVVFTGGEPLMRLDFFKLAERAKMKNLSVMLFTNGTLINNKIALKLANCVDEIQFSLDGATREINDRIRGKGVYDKVFNAIQLLKDTPIKLKLSIVLMPQNIEDFRANVEEFARALEEVEMKFSFAINEGRANKSFLFPSAPEGERELQEILKILYKKRLKAMNKVEPNLMARNCGYGEVITVSCDGDVFPCAILKYKAGNIKEDNLQVIVRKIREEMISSNVENLEQCPQCDLRYICSGGCRLNNITHNKNILKPYCPSQKKEDFYSKLVVRDTFDALSYWLGKNKQE